MSDPEGRLARIRSELARAAAAAGREPGEITLIAATKTQTADTIRAAVAAGITDCGENRVQELTAHLAEGAYEGARVHFIGHLQTNKVKYVVGKVCLIHSVSSEKLLLAIEKQAEKLDEKNYLVKIKYSSDDRSEMVIRILSFGPTVKVLGSEDFKKLVVEKLKKQLKCGLK